MLRQRADLSDPASISAAVDAAIKRFGRIDALCNLAGGFAMGDKAHELSAEAWNHMMELNAGTVLRMCNAVVPHMLKAGGGKIVNIGANSALSGKAEMGAYIASKSAVIRLTETMAAELRGHNINVNCVLPSIIDTPQNRAAMPKADPAKWVAPDGIGRRAAVPVLAGRARHPRRGDSGGGIELRLARTSSILEMDPTTVAIDATKPILLHWDT